MSFGGWIPFYRQPLVGRRQLNAPELLITMVIVLTVIHGLHCDLDFSISKHLSGKLLSHTFTVTFIREDSPAPQITV
jgi:hypothetical protein